ncbi:PQQ-like beta-propeller repeat protein [Actinopolymorpha rutila]|uniref:Outer membrane protein assembly factor BamB n=1 Tax=Actinopolymorpha rutila TaxID=446787 RepID=A0A852ZK99_9ACTN|nr:PQQ-like beta-propeller repeat protein [Actinopolymorpha rutila]NYH92032.1 outer membrane protein assembly factor BamB [Actinopolymorpha rutila]
MTTPERDNDGISRRRLLGAAGAAGVGAVAATLPVGAATAHAAGGTRATSEAAQEAAPTITDLGPAVLGAPIVGATVAGDRGFVVTRGLEPPILAEYDLNTGKVVANHELTTGLGGWGMVAVDGSVYAGMYSVADIHRLNLATGIVERLGRLGNEQFAFDLTASPSGKVYAGTFPGGKVYEIDPTTGTGSPVIRDLRQAVPGLQYVRCVAVGPDGTVYAGTGTSARLVAIDPVSGARTDILPASLHGESFVYDVAVSADHVVAGTEPHGQLVVIDRADPTQNTAVTTGERTIDAITIDGNTAYFTARPSGALYAYRLDTGELTRLAVPVAAEETRGVFVRDGVVHGASGAGLWWTYDAANGGKVNVVDLVDVGLRTGPEPPQSVSYAGGSGQVLVGGNFGLQVRDLARRTSRRVRVDGEAKSMTPVRDRTAMAIYPGALVDAYDHRSANVVRIGEIGGLANRPRSMRLHPPGRLLLIGVRNEYGIPGGALAIVDVRSGAIDRYDNLAAGQGVAAVASHRDVAYLGTEISVDGAPPVAKEAVLAGFDLTTRRVVWTWTAVPGATGYVSLVHHHGLLYGVTAQGALLVADPVTRTVVGSGRIPAGRHGYLAVRAGAVLAVTSEVLARVNPDATTTTLVSGLAGDWYNEPQLAVDEDSGDVFTVRGRNLVRIHLPS